MKKLTLALLLAVMMLVNIMPISVAAADDIPTITIWAGMSSNCPDETLNQVAVRDLLGINYTVEWTQGDFQTALNMKINSGEIPDIVVFWNDTVAANALINSGLVMPLDEFVADTEKYPELASIPTKVLDYVRSNTGDGKLWYLPGWYSQEPDDPWPGWTVDAWWVRTDLLEQAGMTADDLTTLDGIEAFARAVANTVTEDGLLMNGISYSTESGINLILNAFGMDTGKGKSGMPAITEQDGEKIFLYDNANYKAAYQWINRLYREGLIDMEVTTQKNERLTEKFNSGAVAIYPGDAWSINLSSSWYAMTTAEDNIAAANVEPYKVPSSSVTSTIGKTSYVDPYNSAMVFVSKDCKNLEAVMTFLNWCNTQDPAQQQIVNEGPVGLYWDWIDEPYGEWDFVPDYKALRDSGDQALVDTCTTQMYWLSSYSKEWYPWWTQYSGNNNEYATRINEYCTLISSTFGTTRTMHVYDAVPLLSGGVVDRYLASLDAVAEEYGARLTMASSDAEFESVWNEFQSQLESRAHWSEMKAEWQSQYVAYVALTGEW